MIMVNRYFLMLLMKTGYYCAVFCNGILKRSLKFLGDSLKCLDYWVLQNFPEIFEAKTSPR